jgi:outer membrane protein assembly factor BamB
MLRFLLALISYFLLACSGEKYDLSNAMNILPEKTDNFIVSPELARTSIYIEGEAYAGTLTPKKLASLRDISSNFELFDGGAFYVSSSKKLVKAKFSGEREIVSFEERLAKKKNVSDFLLAINGDMAIIVSNSGDVVAFDTSIMQIKWDAKINDIVNIKPFIYKDEVVISTSSGGLYTFDIFTGEKGVEVLKVEDPTGVNFNTISNLEIIPIYTGRIFISYYRSELLFFDISTKLKLYNLSLLENSLDFSRITSTPIFYGNFLFVGTSSNLSAVSLATGGKIWDTNGKFTSNIASAGGFIFIFEQSSRNLLAFSSQNGSVKWKTELEIPKKTSKLWISTFSPNAILTIDEKGYITKLNIVNGSIFEEKKRQVAFSKRFNYRLINGKIYYTDGSDNLIILE